MLPTFEREVFFSSCFLNIYIYIYIYIYFFFSFFLFLYLYTYTPPYSSVHFNFIYRVVRYLNALKIQFFFSFPFAIATFSTRNCQTKSMRPIVTETSNLCAAGNYCTLNDIRDNNLNERIKDTSR